LSENFCLNIMVTLGCCLGTISVSLGSKSELWKACVGENR